VGGVCNTAAMVSAPCPPLGIGSVWTEICLCHACSCHEILRAETAGQESGLGHLAQRERLPIAITCEEGTLELGEHTGYEICNPAHPAFVRCTGLFVLCWGAPLVQRSRHLMRCGSRCVS
jgi:hypothetical protein